MIVRNGQTFATGKCCRTEGCSAQAQIVVITIDIVKINPVSFERFAGSNIDAVPVVCDLCGFADDRQCLKSATFMQLTRNIGQESIEQATPLVLGLVDDAGWLVHSGGLVFKSAHLFQR